MDIILSVEQSISKIMNNEPIINANQSVKMLITTTDYILKISPEKFSLNHYFTD